MNRLPALAAASALLVLLAGCAPASPTPTPTTTTTSSSPSPSATSDAGEPLPDRPVPRFGDGCAALVPAATVSAIFTYPVEPHDFLETEYAALPSIPRNAWIAQSGGMLCEWSNGEAYSSATGVSAFRGVQIAILPEAADG